MAAHSEENVVNQEHEQVIAVVEKMTLAFDNKAIEGVLASYEVGAGVLFEPGQWVSDPAGLKARFDGYFQLNPKFSYPNGHEVYIANDLALHIAPWVMRGTAPDGSAITQQGLSVAVLRKQIDGAWLLVLDNPHGQLLLEN